MSFLSCLLSSSRPQPLVRTMRSRLWRRWVRAVSPSISLHWPSPRRDFKRVTCHYLRPPPWANQARPRSCRLSPRPSSRLRPRAPPAQTCPAPGSRRSRPAKERPRVKAPGRERALHQPARPAPALASPSPRPPPPGWGWSFPQLSRDPCLPPDTDPADTPSQCPRPRPAGRGRWNETHTTTEEVHPMQRRAQDSVPGNLKSKLIFRLPLYALERLFSMQLHWAQTKVFKLQKGCKSMLNVL